MFPIADVLPAEVEPINSGPEEMPDATTGQKFHSRGNGAWGFSGVGHGGPRGRLDRLVVIVLAFEAKAAHGDGLSLVFFLAGCFFSYFLVSLFVLYLILREELVMIENGGGVPERKRTPER